MEIDPFQTLTAISLALSIVDKIARQLKQLRQKLPKPSRSTVLGSSQARGQ